MEKCNWIMGFVTERLDRCTDFDWYRVKALQILTASLLYPNFSIASFIILIEGCDTLKRGQASRERRETCSDGRKWGKNSLRLDQSQKSARAGNVSRVLLRAPAIQPHFICIAQISLHSSTYKCFCKCRQPVNDASELGFALFLLNRPLDAPQWGAL